MGTWITLSATTFCDAVTQSLPAPKARVKNTYGASVLRLLAAGQPDASLAL